MIRIDQGNFDGTIFVWVDEIGAEKGGISNELVTEGWVSQQVDG